MAYKKLNLKDGDTLTKDHFNHIERGIEKSTELATKNDKRLNNIEQGLPPADFVRRTDGNIPNGIKDYAEVLKIGGKTVCKYKISGLWKFNETIDVSKEFTENVGFQEYRDFYTCRTMQVYYDQWDDEMHLNYDGSSVYEAYNDGNGWWYDDGYRTVHFSNVPQEVSSDFAEWFMANATSSGGTITKEIIGKTVVTQLQSVSKNGAALDTLTIPTEVQALKGYGESNPDNINEYNYIDFVNQKFVRYGYMENGAWVTAYEEIDIANILTADNFLKVEGGGTIAQNDNEPLSVPIEIEYQLLEG